jgi:hypothetical protein
MNEEALANETILDGVSPSVSAIGWFRSAIKRYWHWAVIVALAILLWIPRMSGPIDLRWDAGVYYVLGTSLATGQGYRILSEPGSPQALQYPPLLPAIVAVYERALGSTDPAIVGPWLRISYAGLFLVYGLAVLALARRYLRPIYALAATAFCLFHIWTIFMSDLLFAEIPLALVSVVFVLVAASNRFGFRWHWLREASCFALAAAGFLLRTAGVVLFVAWIIEALVRKRWQMALLRIVLALLPIFLWQTYVARVHRSGEYRYPAYAYQRAPYQNYNVGYLENILLLDPFKPELGTANGRALASRLLVNFARIPDYLGQAASAPRYYWQSALELRPFSHLFLSSSLVLIPTLALGAFVIAGIFVFIRDGAWLPASIAIFSVGLMCLTPWPEEFNRYLAPVAPLVTIAAVVGLQRFDATLQMRQSRVATIFRRWSVAGFAALVLAVQVRSAVRLFHSSQETLAQSANGIGPAGAHFFYDRNWLAWEQAVAWIKSHAIVGDIIATTAPHQVYLRTGLRAVYPPFDPNPARALHQLSGVPVKYVIIDEFEYRDFSRRYALPAVESDPAAWRLVYSIRDTRVYECLTRS